MNFLEYLQSKKKPMKTKINIFETNAKKQATKGVKKININ